MRGSAGVRASNTFRASPRTFTIEMAERRTLLRRLAALSGVTSLSGCAGVFGGGTDRDAELPPNPHAGSLPRRQHAWNDVLARDEHGNPVSPRHHRILFLDLDVPPSADAARTVERAMRGVEAAYDWEPRGLLHVLAWGSKYFDEGTGLERAPIDHPQVLSRTDDPDLRSFDAALVLASDIPSHLTATEAALFGGQGELAGVEMDVELDSVFTIASRRTGFIGEGLPEAHNAAEGIPEGVPPDDAPMFTGFFSGYEKTQASEDRVTIQESPFAGGTTMHISHIQESLDHWWDGLDEVERVARMFSPDTTPDDVASFETDVPVTTDVRENAREHGVVGHHEKVHRAREDGTPIILRRDFNTVDHGRAGLVFLALQRSLADFRKTRRAMNGWYLRDDHEQVTDRENNGLLNFITVRSRANFYVPPRDERAFPEW